MTARPSRDLVTAANQQITKEWWEDRRRDFELYISQPVIQESNAGDPEAAKRRLNVLEDYSQLDVTEESMVLAQELIKQVPLPEKAELDALHIAIATVHGMDYLLTWNCTHIANASLRHNIETICYMMGYEPPIICTPQELMEV